MGPAIKGAFGKNQGFRAFTAYNATFLPLRFTRNCWRRIAGHLPCISDDRKYGREFLSEPHGLWGQFPEIQVVISTAYVE